MYGGWGSGGWDAGDAKSSYEQYSLSHGRTPGGGAAGGGGGGRGGRSRGAFLWQLFWLLFVISLAACLFKGFPLLLTLAVAAGLAGLLTLVLYGIARMVSGGREK